MKLGLADLAHFMIGVSVLFGFIAWKQLPVFAKLVVTVQLFGFATDTIASFTHGNNSWLINSYLLIEVPLAISAGYRVKPSRGKQIFVIIALLIFFAAWTQTARKLFYINLATNTLVLGYFFIVIIFLWQLLQMLFDEKYDSNSMIVCFCVLFYFSVIIPLFAFDDLIATLEKPTRRKIGLITPILNITQSIMLSWVFFRYIRKPRLARE